MANGYIGKISAVVTANTSDLSRKLAGSVKDVTAFATQLDSSFKRSSASAERSFERIFTPLQRLQRQLKSAISLNVRTDKQVGQIQQIQQALREVVAPISEIAKGFDRVSDTIAGEFTPALNRAQKDAKVLERAINSFGAVSEASFARVRDRADETARAFGRIREAASAASSLATGQELRFANPALAAENARATALQSRASALTPDQITGGGIAGLIAQQRQSSEEAARLQARLENIRATRQGDATEAERTLASQVAAYGRVNTALEEQIVLLQNVGASTQLRSTTDPVGRSIQQRSADILRARDAEQASAAAAAETEAAQQRVVEAARTRLAIASQLLQVDERETQLIARQGESVNISDRVQGRAAIRRAVEEEAAFRQRAADEAEREAAAVERLSQSQNRLLAQEIERTSGASARRNAAAFDDATAGVLNRQAPDAGVFERQARTLNTELERTARLRQEFLALPQDVQQSLEGERAALNNIGTAARDGAASLGVLAEANDRMAASIASANEQLSEQARLSRANAQLAIDPDQPPPPPPRTDLGNQLQQAGADRIRGIIGPQLDDGIAQSQRSIDALAARVGNVRTQLETLPDSVRTRFVPEIERATRQLIRLQNAPAATADQIEQAAQRVQRLEQSARRAAAALDFRASFGGAGLRGIEEGLNQQALGGYTAQLQILQRTLAGTSQAARGPAVVAFNNLRNAIADAMERGTLETEETRRALQLLTRDATTAVAAARGINPGRLGQQLRRAGDIARGAGANFGLAVQQAIFAVDDFFSVSGDLGQRIRGAGNNISQLGFILGGTFGLAAGVAVSVTAQLVAGLIRFYNEGRTAADVTKVLNDSLEKQISLAKELKDALRGAFEGVIEGGFSRQTRELREFRKELDEIREKQREQREEAAINANPTVVAARQEVNAAQRQVEESQSPQQFILARQRLDRARAQEQAARQAALVQPDFEAGEAVRRSLRAEESARTDFESGVLIRGEEVARRRQRAEAALARADQQRIAGDEAGAINTQREEIRARIQELSDPSISGQVEAQQAVVELQSILDRLELGLVAAIDGVVVASLENSFAAGLNVARVQERAVASDAFGAQAAIDQANAARDAAARQLEEARRVPDVDQRQAAVAEASAGLAEADRKAEEVANQFNSVISSVETFASVLDRVSNDLANTVAQEARSAADQARRDANAADARNKRGDPGAVRDANFAEDRRARLFSDARTAEERAFEIQQESARTREAFERDAIAGNLGADAQALIRQRDEAQAVLDDRESTDAQLAEATRQRDEANFRLDQQFEDSGAGRRLRRRADEADRRAQEAAQLDADILRGRELAETPAARAGRELADNLRGLESFFEDRVDNGRLAQADADAQLAAARRQQIDQAFRSQAPAIAGLADSVANALLQGPSRAALNATDVSTVEGARELNRLIRGDDAARDQNLEELRRQSGQLQELIQAVRDNGGDIAD
jgi:hypothetical protein